MNLSPRLATLFLLTMVFGCNAPVEETQPEAAAEPPMPVADAPPAVDEPDLPMRRLLVLARQGQTLDDVVMTANQEFTSVVTAEPLFPDIDDDELSRSYIVMAPITDASVSPWDAAYAFQAAGDFELVEPDREDTLVPAFRDNAATAGCALGDTVENQDIAWALKKINASAAWELDPPGIGKKLGEGISICHPDTGWTAHDDMDSLDLSRARNVMNGTDDARDPHNSGGLLNPGHGTATGSVIGSRGGVAAITGTTPPGKITGVAPMATIVPIRTVNSVIQIFDSDVAKAVTYAVEAQCDVVSMSLGGRGFFGLKRAVRYANDNGLILVAASGNCVGIIVAPAAYKETVAAAATNDQDKPWKGSSRGHKITLSAPGESVWNANGQAASNLPADIKFSNGTSFAAAEIAGAAALWLAYHTREEVEQAAGGKRISDLFMRVLQDSARTPGDWDASKYGPGILDLEALLLEDIAAQGPSMAPPAGTPGQEAVELLAGVIDRNPAEVARALAIMLDNPADFDAEVTRWIPELMDVAMRDPDTFKASLDAALAPPAPTGGPPRVQAQSTLNPLLSESLRSAMQ